MSTSNGRAMVTLARDFQTLVAGWRFDQIDGHADAESRSIADVHTKLAVLAVDDNSECVDDLGVSPQAPRRTG